MPSRSRRFYLAVFALLHASSAHLHQPPSNSGPASHESCAIDPKAIVSDACASFSTLDSLNTDLLPSIHSLTQSSDFFSYYRLNLYNKVCPFWSDESSMCGNIACAVNTIENEDDIPLIWRAEELGKLEGPKAHHPNRRLQQQAKPLMGGLGDEVGESCVVEYDDECDERDYCVPEDESATAKGDYVSLVDNPERFTGYSGPGANQVWEAIYRENCFSKVPGADPSSSQSSPFGAPKAQRQAANDLRSVMRGSGRQQQQQQQQQPAGLQGSVPASEPELDEECLEKRVFYRVISGMHASISTHLCWDHLNQTTGKWGPNLQCFQQRLHDHPDRISNLYFNYALVLRAVAKVRRALETYTFCSGDAAQDRLTKDHVLTLANKIASGPQIYDESLMFQDSSVVGLKDDFRSRFRNVSRTMDCVGCDKCRLWGKLQTAGYGTALKILFEFDENDNSKNPPLRRTELVALINTLAKLSHGLSALGKFEGMLGAGHQNAAKTWAQSATSDLGLEDDLLAETENESPEETFEFKEDFKNELVLIMQTARWVVQRWLELPRLFFHIITVWLRNTWNAWLGVPDQIRLHWTVHYSPPTPPRLKRDEL